MNPFCYQFSNFWQSSPWFSLQCTTCGGLDYPIEPGITLQQSGPTTVIAHLNVLALYCKLALATIVTCLAYSSESYCVTTCDDVTGVAKIYDYTDTAVTYSKYYFTHFIGTANPTCAGRLHSMAGLTHDVECGAGGVAWTWCESCITVTTAGAPPTTSYECRECKYQYERFLTPPYGPALVKAMFDCSAGNDCKLASDVYV